MSHWPECRSEIGYEMRWLCGDDSAGRAHSAEAYANQWNQPLAGGHMRGSLQGLLTMDGAGA